jgi:hypothetical protein
MANSKIRKFLIVSFSPLSQFQLSKTFDFLNHEVTSRFLGAAHFVQLNWKPVSSPTDEQKLREHCHLWANAAYLVVSNPNQCFPSGEFLDPEISKRPIYLRVEELTPDLFLQDITQYKSGLLNHWLILNSKHEALSYELEIIEPTAAQIQSLQQKAQQVAESKIQALFKRHVGKYIVVTSNHELIGEAKTSEEAEEMAKQYLDRCNIYGPTGTHVGERWFGR